MISPLIHKSLLLGGILWSVVVGKDLGEVGVWPRGLGVAQGACTTKPASTLRRIAKKKNNPVEAGSGIHAP